MSFQTEETERTKPPNVKQHDGSREEGSHKSYYHISSSPPSKHMVGLHFLASLELGLTVWPGDNVLWAEVTSATPGQSIVLLM